MVNSSSVCYLISGQAHLPYLVCSLYTLREHYEGDILVCAWPESFDIAKKISEDSRLNITDVVCQEPPYRKRDGVRNNAQFIHKIQLVQSLKERANTVLYLDADTTIHGDISPLIMNASMHGFVATQFNDWTTSKGIANKRIKRLYEFPEIDSTLVDLLCDNAWPSVNGGIWAANPESPVLSLWFEWTLVAKSLFIADEVILHVMLPKFVPTKQLVVLGDYGKWNSSTRNKFQSKHLNLDDVVIWHYHGDSNLRPNKSQLGFDLWWPIYQKCLVDNIGNIQDWISGINNKHLKAVNDSMLHKKNINWC